MPITFELKDNIGIFTTIGDVEFEEGIQVLTQGLDSILQNNSLNLVLFDIRKSTENRSNDEMLNVAKAVKEKLEEAKLAMVVESDLYFGMSRMFSNYAEHYGMKTEVFREYQPAVDWLQG